MNWEWSKNMNRFTSTIRLSIAFLLLCPFIASGQSRDSIKVVAGKQYDRSWINEWLWGKHYRKEWATPVTMPLFFLDTAAGGLRPYEAGGGRQTKTLHLRNTNDKEYVLRSIDKRFGKALPDIYRGSFVEKILNDQVSIGHPYSAITISPMAEAAGIFHTNPTIGYVPRQQRLDSFNVEFGNTLYLFEQLPDENWQEAPNFANAKNIIGTEKMLQKIFEDNDNVVNQRAFVRARLFDMFIGDWGRHEDQWRWGLAEEGKPNIYEPIPRDRDQAYTKFDGFLLKPMMKLAGINHLQSFGPKIRDIKRFNYPARNLDRKFANEPTLDDWVTTAKDLQNRLTDQVIENAVHRLPPEVYPISGEEIITKLKSRRDRLVEIAKKYYYFLAKKVDVVGSDKNEFFQVRRMDGDKTEVNVYKITKDGEVKSTPIYSRVFDNTQTKEIRLFGLKGNDVFRVDGDVFRGTKVRIIGGPDNDSIINTAKVQKGRHRTEIYDSRRNVITTTGNTELHYTRDTALYGYHYDTYTPDKSGLKPSILYSNEDRFYVSLGYMVRKNQWRKYPFAYEHGVYLHYSISQAAFSLTYKGIINQLIGKWSLSLNANWDAIRWTNFYGLGNETKFETTDRNFYRMRSKEYSAGVGLFRNLGKFQFLSFSTFYQNIKVIDDPERFIAQKINPPKNLYGAKDFIGLQADYNYTKLNDPVVPTNGVDFFATAVAVQNLRADSSFANVSANFDKYFQLSRKFVLVIRGGAATLTGRPEFYQYNWIGGSQRLRGYKRNRFFGKSAVNNNNELQWINNFRSRIFNGKAGLVAFYDIGRVWMPDEQSSKWHPGWGGGILLAPFNKFSLSFTYGMSPELNLFHIRFNRIFL